MTRLRRAYIFGTVTAGVGVGETSITDASFEALPEVAGGDTLALLVGGGSGVPPECMIVTDHAADSDTITVLRGQETDGGHAPDSTHAADVRWRHGPTPADFGGDEGFATEADITDAVNAEADARDAAISAAITALGSPVEWKGAWNASSNSPSLADGSGDTGDMYRVSTPGTRDLGAGSVAYAAGDLVVYDGSVWQRFDAVDLTPAELAAMIHAATSKATPVDADELALVDSEASNGLKKLTLANLKAAISALGPTVVQKGSDQSVTSSTTLVDCTDLGFAVVAGQTYYIDGYLLSTGANAGDLAVGATHPGGTLRLSADGMSKDASSAPAGTGAGVNVDAVITASGGSQTHLGTVSGVTTDVRVMGFYTCTTNGTFQLQFAQRSSNATATKILAGSWLRYHT